MKIKVGIFFGGPSREREISFAGGRTVYDNLNKSIFEPVPIFVDGNRNFVLLDWQHIYKGSIRDFYPPIQAVPTSANAFQVYAESLGDLSPGTQQKLASQVGQWLSPVDLARHIDLAFLALHGEYGEDGQLQQQLEQLGIPYTGSGVRASQIGMDKALQKELMGEHGFARPKVVVLPRADFLKANLYSLYERAASELGFPLVIRPANQGSSIGVSIIDRNDGIEAFEQAVNRAFFRELVPVTEWRDRSDYDRVEYLRFLNDLRDGLGFPLRVSLGAEQQKFYHPEDLLTYLNTAAQREENAVRVFVLEAERSEERVILEQFIKGKEFSCIVLRREDGSAVALPPTEIVKGGEVFDYRSKYLPGLSRKITPIDLPLERIEAIRRECERLFTELGFQVYARIDGFHTESDTIFLNDPNTTSGMLPSSFFFHQAAEIGLNPSQFLTYIIRASLQERLTLPGAPTEWQQLLERLESGVQALRQGQEQRQRIGVILGGYSAERHISVESGRNVYEKLSSSTRYNPLPIFLTGEAQHYTLYRLPINLLLKDNADDIRDKLLHWESHPSLERIRQECSAITHKYASPDVVFAPVQLTYNQLQQEVDAVFIALHGRPGEDGQVQMELEARGIPYNGSSVQSSRLTINKYRTLQTLARNGLPVTQQLVLDRATYQQGRQRFLDRVEQELAYPLVAKPVDDGCSSAVKVVRNRTELEAYAGLIFEPTAIDESSARQRLRLKHKEEFPVKEEILFEQLIQPAGAIHFLEITGGMLTHYHPDGTLRYEVFEPSETLAGGEVLSLEEKFLAGEGQNITPARLAPAGMNYETIAHQVKADLERVARLANVEGYCRIDAFVRVYPDGRAETVVIEINSLPGMTPATAIFHQAARAGYKPADFIDRIIQFGMARQQRRSGQPATPTTPLDTTLAAAPLSEMGRSATTAVPPVPTPRTPVVPVERASSQRVRFGSEFDDKNSPKYRPEPWYRRGMFGFFLSMYFLKNLLVLLALVAASYLGVVWFLNWYTNHGETLQVPNLEGMTLEDAERTARDRGLRLQVIDRPFDLAWEPNVVLKQDPGPMSRVKRKRTIYLTVSDDTPPQVPLPTLVGNYDYQQYTRKLEALQIRYEIKEQVYDPTQEENTIMHFYYGNRLIRDADLRKGVEVPQGAKLEFVVTVRQTGEVVVPNLVCRRFSDASFVLSSMEMNVGRVFGDVIDQDAAYIYRQEPAYDPDATIPVGTTINLYLSDTRPEGCPADGSPLPYTPPDDQPNDEGDESYRSDPDFGDLRDTTRRRD